MRATGRPDNIGRGRAAVLGIATVVCACAPRAPQPAARSMLLLEEMTWLEAERVLTPDAVVVLPLGAAAKEHGPHLRLDNDWRIAEYLKRRLAARTRVVIAPTLNVHFYPAFAEYPGSISLRLETARGHDRPRGDVARRVIPGLRCAP